MQTDIFPRIQDDKLVYLGVDGERRDGASSDTYYRFKEAVETGKHIEDINRELRVASKDVDLLLSEEVLCVSSVNVTWQQKIVRVSEILSGLDYKILVSVREPISAMMSYYIELYPRFMPMKFVDCSLHHNDMFIFHYRKLIRHLYECFDKKRLFVFKYEDLASAKVDDLISMLSNGRFDGNIEYGNHNRRTKDGSLIVSDHAMSPYFFLKFLIKKLGIYDTRLGDAIKEFAKRNLGWLDAMRFGSVKFDKPSDADIAYIREKIAPENSFLDEEYGIRY